MQSIAIFGATGVCGKALVERGLHHGHELTLLVRNRKKADQLFDCDNRLLKIVEGDITDVDQVTEVMNGKAAAFSCLASFEPPHNSMSVLTENVIQSAARLGRPNFRYITYSLCGVDLDGDRVSHAIQNTLRVFSPNKFGPAIEDHTRTIALLKSSTLDYTLFQTATMVDKPIGAPYVSGDVESCPGVRLWDRWGVLDAADVCIQAIGEKSTRRLQLKYL